MALWFAPDFIASPWIGGTGPPMTIWGGGLWGDAPLLPLPVTLGLDPRVHAEAERWVIGSSPMMTMEERLAITANSRVSSKPQHPAHTDESRYPDLKI